MKKIKQFFKKTIHFLNRDLWNLNLKDFPLIQGLYYKVLKVVIIAIRGFQEDKCAVRAASLTYFSLLSIVPVLGLAFGISQAFGFEDALSNVLSENLQVLEEQALNDANADSQEEFTVLDQIEDLAINAIENTKGGVVAGTGLIFLFYIVIQLLHNVEDALNKIWEIKKHRSFIRILTDYLSITLISPIFIILSSSITVYIKSQIQSLAAEAELSDYIDPVLSVFLQIIPYTLIWILLTLLYMILPNTRVNFKAALIAGIFAGTLYQVTQWAYITFQIGVNRYGELYTAFAAIPLFMIWLQVSWLIFLYGAEISYAIQNINKYRAKKEQISLNPFQKKLLSLLITNLIVKRFQSDQDYPYTVEELSQTLNTPEYFVQDLINELTNQRILSETQIVKGLAYQPAQDINNLTITYVIDKIEHIGENNYQTLEGDQFEKIKNILHDFQNALKQLPQNVLIKNI